MPPASGMNAILRWVSPPIRSVSEPTQSPWVVASMSKTPTPRARPGFQLNGRPLLGSSAKMPSRGTAPGPALSPANGLFTQRMWPPA